MEKDLILKSITTKAPESEPQYIDYRRPTLPEYIKMVLLDTNYPTTVPHRRSIPYPVLRQMLWRIIAFRLNAENRKWKKDHFNTSIIQKILCWCCGLTGDVGTPSGIVIADIPLHKGIWLYGRPGVGKTFFMECLTVALCACYHGSKAFRIVNMKSLERELVARKDIALLEKYLHHTWCFDDVGFETQTKIWGNEVDPFVTIINERYQKWELYKQVTHVTSNYPLEAVGEIYDTRLTRRVKAMFHPILLDGNDKTEI